jgi:hypothetical protein
MDDEDDEMTISVEDRKAAIQRVLLRLSEMYWESPPGFFDEADLQDTALFETTLTEMREAFLLEEHPPLYRLTAHGWFMSQRQVGRFETPEFEHRRGTLCKVPKRRSEAHRAS